MLLAAELDDIPALVLIAPYLGMPRLLEIAAATHWLWGGLVGEVTARNPRSVRDPIEREKNLAYGAVTGRELHELSTVVRLRQESIAECQSANSDNPVSRRSPHRARRCRIRTRITRQSRKKLVWTEGAGHIITVDYGRERVFSEVEKWLKLTHARRGMAAAGTSERAAAERPES